MAETVWSWNKDSIAKWNEEEWTIPKWIIPDNGCDGISHEGEDSIFKN